MAEYRCNIGSLYDLADRTRREADDLEKHSDSSSQELNSELSSWSGGASEAYKENGEMLTKDTKETAETMRAYADYIQNVADTIKEADDYCATAKI